MLGGVAAKMHWELLLAMAFKLVFSEKGCGEREEHATGFRRISRIPYLRVPLT